MKTGDKIELTPNEKTILEQYNSARLQAQTLANYAAGIMKQQDALFWKTVRQLYPETEGFEMACDGAALFIGIKKDAAAETPKKGRNKK